MATKNLPGTITIVCMFCRNSSLSNHITFTFMFFIKIDYGSRFLRPLYTKTKVDPLHRQLYFKSLNCTYFIYLGKHAIDKANLIVYGMIETIWSKLTGDPLRQVRACV